MTKKIERTPEEVAVINKHVEAERAKGKEKAVEVKLDEKREDELAPKYTKKVYKELLEAYKEQNPVKYEAKKDALEAKLKNLK